LGRAGAVSKYETGPFKHPKLTVQKIFEDLYASELGETESNHRTVTASDD